MYYTFIDIAMAGQPALRASSACDSKVLGSWLFSRVETAERYPRNGGSRFGVDIFFDVF